MIPLPSTIAEYFVAANRQDIEAMLAAFTVDATVRDEHKDHAGHAAIRTWVIETTQNYHGTIELLRSDESNGTTTVAALVKGNS